MKNSTRINVRYERKNIMKKNANRNKGSRRKNLGEKYILIILEILKVIFKNHF